MGHYFSPLQIRRAARDVGVGTLSFRARCGECIRDGVANIFWAILVGLKPLDILCSRKMFATLGEV
jgi:hypothetical protein